jgi:hypothetical protein
MGIDGQSIARREISGYVPCWADMLVRLLFLAHVQGKQRKGVEPIKPVELLVKQPILVLESKGQSEPSLQEVDTLPT